MPVKAVRGGGGATGCSGCVGIWAPVTTLDWRATYVTSCVATFISCCQLLTISRLPGAYQRLTQARVAQRQAQAVERVRLPASGWLPRREPHEQLVVLLDEHECPCGARDDPRRATVRNDGGIVGSGELLNLLVNHPITVLAVMKQVSFIRSLRVLVMIKGGASAICIQLPERT